MTLQRFLDTKPLYYDKIDLQRMPDAYASIKDVLRVPPVIHVVGTNGKGTTGRFLASALRQQGFEVGHYTSPHIRKFNERIWLDGSDVSDAQLEIAHQELSSFLDRETIEALSYFEYTTFLAMHLFATCDWVVLEAGLGGEFDATNVFAKQLSLFTPIDIDHQAFLGDTISSIAGTKLRSMGPRALIGAQPHEEVYGLFESMAKERGSEAYFVERVLDDVDLAVIVQASRLQALPEYLVQNLSMAVAAMRILGLRVESRHLVDAPMFGRLSALDEHIIVDVGHNVLAARVIRQSLEGRRMVLVYNSYKDKEYARILELLRPIITHVEIIDVEDGRIEERSRLVEAITSTGLEARIFEKTVADVDYLVFGSFSVVEAFLRVYDGE